MNEHFLAFLKSPDSESYLTLRRQFIASDAYDPYNDDLLDIMRAVEQRQFEVAEAALNKSMPNLLLSPQAHFLVAEVAENQGDPERAEAERFMAAACIQGILTTGDGSREKPYLVTRTTDEYDILGYLEKQLGEQTLHHLDEQHIDCIRSPDGTETWFDVTDAYHKLPDTRVFEQLENLFKDDGAWSD